MTKQHVVPVSDAHRAFEKLIEGEISSDEHLIVERGGAPVAVVLSYQEYERMRSARALSAFEEFSRALGQDVQRAHLDEDALLQAVQDVKREIYAERYDPQT